MEWKERAEKVLKDSLFPVPTELNELDWKVGLSPKTDRLAEHISAFANQRDGGFMVFGIDDKGEIKSVNQTDVENIDLPPKSRNETLANTLFLLKFCERRGSGIDKAIEAIEIAGLPPVHFDKSESHTRVTLTPAKKFKEMTKEERIFACYQHTCLLYEDKKAINNQSVRERFGIDKHNSSIASRIIIDTFTAGFIKQQEPANESKRYATYIPYYA
jgi:predicted HTH transcriptional regulator